MIMSQRVKQKFMISVEERKGTPLLLYTIDNIIVWNFDWQDKTTSIIS